MCEILQMDILKEGSVITDISVPELLDCRPALVNQCHENATE